MKKSILQTVANLCAFLALVLGVLTQANGQQLVRFQFDEFQQVEFARSTQAREISLSSNAFVLKIQNLNNLSHMGNRLDVYGNLLLIEQWVALPDGRIRLTLRREDGRDFFNLFPTVTATIEPVARDVSE